MEKTSWNREQLVAEFGSCGSLNDLIKSVEKKFEERGEVICFVSVNGMQFTETDESNFAKSSFDEIDSFEIKTSRIDSLIEETLRQVKRHTEEQVKIAESVADQFRNGEMKEGLEGFQSLVDGCQLLRDSIEQLRLTNQDMNINWADLEKRLIDVFGQILATFKNRDFILLADLIEYELTSIFDNIVKKMSLNGLNHAPEESAIPNDSKDT